MPILRGDDPANIHDAARALAAGELVAFPTETVYGLGARADDDTAVAAIFAAKGRPADHPLIVHVHDLTAAMQFTPAMPAAASELVAQFWPGPVTLIVPRRPGVGAAAAAGAATIGLRCPDHPVARALLRAAAEFGVAGVAAPSANRFGRVSPTRAEHVRAELGDALLILDGGACREGIESAIIDCSRDQPYLLRPGTVDRRRIEAALGRPLLLPDSASPVVPGSLESHYAPLAEVRLAGADRLTAAVMQAQAADRRLRLGVYARQRPPSARPVDYRRMPDNAALAAHELFSVLRQFDDNGVGQIWVEWPPDEPGWDGVRDRLRRASRS
jgi:L-threonylcarbamoyladenylate synthase